jgi:hypothetical protein
MLTGSIEYLSAGIISEGDKGLSGKGLIEEAGLRTQAQPANRRAL